jgi:hypothetical protein
LRTGINEISLLITQHSLDGLDQRVQVAHPIEQVTLDIVVAGLGARSHPNPEIAVLLDKALCPLRSYGQVCPVKVHEYALLFVELVT